MPIPPTTLIAVAIAAVIAAWLLRRLWGLLQLVLVAALVFSIPDVLAGRIPPWMVIVWNTGSALLEPLLRQLWGSLQALMPR